MSVSTSMNGGSSLEARESPTARWTRWLPFALVVIVCATACWYGAWRNSFSGSPLLEFQEIGGLAVKQRDLDLGTVWENDHLHYQLPIENRTGSDIRVVDIISSCWCLDVKPRSLVISARKTNLVDITLDLTHRVPGEIGLAERNFTVEIKPVFQSGMPRERGWTLHGIVKSRITLDTLSVDFREVPVRGETPAARKVLATVHIPFDRLEATTDPRVATVKVERHKSCVNIFELTVSWNPSLPVGQFQSLADIDVLNPAGERHHAAKLPISGRMQPEVRLLPSRLILGSKPIGGKLEAVVVIQAPADVALVMEHIETDSRDLQVESVAIEGVPQGRAYKVIQTVRNEGDQSNLVKFFIESKVFKMPLEMQVCYRGEARTTVNHDGTQPR